MDPMVTTISKDSRKPNYPDYEHAFSYELLKDFEEGRLDGFDMETMRGLVYGYTFTEDYTKGIIPDALSMDYWASKKQGLFGNLPTRTATLRCHQQHRRGVEPKRCLLCDIHQA